MSLSVCCLTSEPAHRVAAALSPLREVCAQIVLVLDDRTDLSSLQPLAGLVDTVLAVEYQPPFERYLDWLHSQCHGDWILRLDGDEIPSPEMVAELAEVVARRDVLQGHIRRRWLYSAQHWLDQPPWDLDYQLRLVRNDPALLRFAGSLHTSVHPAAPDYRFRHPVYHTTLVTLSRAHRERKVAEYRGSAHREHEVPDEAHFLHENQRALTLADVPAAHRLLITRALSEPAAAGASTQPVQVTRVPLSDVDQRWARRPWAEQEYRAAVEVEREDVAAAPGEIMYWPVVVTNQTGRVLHSVPSPGTIRLAYTWRALAGEEHGDGQRAHMPYDLQPGASAVVLLPVLAPSEPGDYEIRVDLVHENVRWFDCAATVRLTVREQPDASRPYGAEFYEQQAAGSRASAERVIGVLRTIVTPRSVLDIGSGVGTWAAEWRRAGVDDVIAVDGDYVDRAALQVCAESFMPADLSQPLNLGRRFDLVQCLEVAEHLPEAFADTLIASIVRHGDLVLFSAAVPGQGGTHHVNEQWPSYWAEKFAARGYAPLDVLRPRIWTDRGIEWWYRQNILLFAAPAAALTLRKLPSQPRTMLDVGHPGVSERADTHAPAPAPETKGDGRSASRRLLGRAARKRTDAGAPDAG